jgi:hypothetical protein
MKLTRLYCVNRDGVRHYTSRKPQFILLDEKPEDQTAKGGYFIYDSTRDKSLNRGGHASTTPPAATTTTINAMGGTTSAVSISTPGGPVPGTTQIAASIGGPASVNNPYMPYPTPPEIATHPTHLRYPPSGQAAPNIYSHSQLPTIQYWPPTAPIAAHRVPPFLPTGPSAPGAQMPPLTTGIQNTTLLPSGLGRGYPSQPATASHSAPLTEEQEAANLEAAYLNLPEEEEGGY